MGHESVTTTERYAPLRPGTFTDADRGLIAVDLPRPAGKVTRAFGSQLAHTAKNADAKKSRNVSISQSKSP